MGIHNAGHFLDRGGFDLTVDLGDINAAIGIFRCGRRTAAPAARCLLWHLLAAIVGNCGPSALMRDRAATATTTACAGNGHGRGR